MLLKRDTELSGTIHDRSEITRMLDEYDRMWNAWRKLSEDHTVCPTLYSADIDFYGNQIGLNRTADSLREIINTISNK